MAPNCIDERKGVPLRSNLLISTRYLWVIYNYLDTTDRKMAFNLSLYYEIDEEWKNDGIGIISLETKVPHILYKGTHE
jgi:hypothetical protein